MVAQHQDSTGAGQIFKTEHRDAMSAGEHPRNHITYQRLWQLIDGIEGPCQGRDGQYMQQTDTADAVDGKEDRQAQESQHDHVLHPVVACKHGAQLVVPCMELNQGVEWYDEHAATGTQQQEVHNQQGVRVQSWQEEECDNDTHCTQRDETRFDVTLRGLTGEQGTDDDAKPGTGQYPLNDNGVVLAERLLGEGRKAGQYDLGNSPEYRQTNNRQPDGSVCQDLVEIVP